MVRERPDPLILLDEVLSPMWSQVHRIYDQIKEGVSSLKLNEIETARVAGMVQSELHNLIQGLNEINAALIFTRLFPGPPRFGESRREKEE